MLYILVKTGYSRKDWLKMPGHLANLSKHTLEEHVNLLRLIEELLTSTEEYGMGLKHVRVQLPVSEDWDIYVEIPNKTPTEFMALIMRYTLIPKEKVQAAARALKLDPSNPLYGTVPLASSWKNVYRINISDAKDQLDKVL